jgi:hypothetical protein
MKRKEKEQEKFQEELKKKIYNEVDEAANYSDIFKSCYK